MSFWNSLEHWFTGLFPRNAKEAQSLVHDIASYVNLASPVVEAVETELKPALGADGIKRAETLNRFLAKFIFDTDQLQAKANALLALPPADMLRDAAEFVLGLMLPVTVDKSMLNLVIEMAYQLYRRAHPAPAVS